MPNYDFRCVACGQTFEQFLPLVRYRELPVCPACQSPQTEKVYLPRQEHASKFADPIVVYQAPDGSYRFPGESQGSSTAKYDRLGYRRVECRDAQDVRRIEGRINADQRSRLQHAAERRQAAMEAVRSQSRSELAHKMSTMSNFGRDVARAMIERNNQKRDRAAGADPGFHVEVMN
jgi:putative FmdB family regulatory protein